MTALTRPPKTAAGSRIGSQGGSSDPSRHDDHGANTGRQAGEQVGENAGIRAGTAAAGDGRGDVVEPLHRNRDFTRFWWGQALAALGGRVSDTALPLLVLASTGSALWAGVFATTRLVVLNLARLPAAAFADRFDRRTTMVRVDLVKAVAWGGLALAVGLGRTPLVALVVVGAVDGLLSAVYNPALGAALRRLVPSEQLPRAVALGESRTAAAGLVGPVVGGGLVALSSWLPLAVNALAYALCALLVVRTRRDLGGRVPSRSGIGADVAEGLREVWRQPFLRASTLWSALLNFATAAAFFGMVPLLSGRGTPPTVIGAMSALVGAGGLVGSLLAPRLSALHAHRSVVGAGVVLTTAVAVAAAAPSSPVVVGCLVLVATVAPVVVVAMTSAIYDVVDDAMTARVLGTMTTVGSVFYPLSFVVMGALLDGVGVGPSYGVLAVVLVLCLPLTLSPAVRAQLTASPGASTR